MTVSSTCERLSRPDARAILGSMESINVDDFVSIFAPALAMVCRDARNREAVMQSPQPHCEVARRASKFVDDLARCSGIVLVRTTKREHGLDAEYRYNHGRQSGLRQRAIELLERAKDDFDMTGRATVALEALQALPIASGPAGDRNVTIDDQGKLCSYYLVSDYLFMRLQGRMRKEGSRSRLETWAAGEAADADFPALPGAQPVLTRHYAWLHAWRNAVFGFRTPQAKPSDATSFNADHWHHLDAEWQSCGLGGPPRLDLAQLDAGPCLDVDAVLDDLPLASLPPVEPVARALFNDDDSAQLRSEGIASGAKKRRLPRLLSAEEGLERRRQRCH